MKIVTMMRIKNEGRWIKKSLESVSQFSSEILILDDGSTDDTVKICENFDNVIEIHKQNDLPFDETRDKNVLLEIAMKRNPDFLFSIDGDQIIQPNISEILFEEINILYPNASLFEFQNLSMWDKPNQYRYDGSSSNAWVKRLLRISKQNKNLYYEKTNFPGNSHCSAIPQNSVGWDNPLRSKIKILHYGKYDQLLRRKKYEFLNKLDPNNVAFDGYRHIISDEGIVLKKLPQDMYVDIG